MFEGARPETSSDILAELARLGETRTWEPGATVVTQGDAADCMYLVLDGELRNIVLGDGGRAVELNTLSAGEMFGELMPSGEPRASTVQVTTRARLTRVTRAAAAAVVADVIADGIADGIATFAANHAQVQLQAHAFFGVEGVAVGAACAWAAALQARPRSAPVPAGDRGGASPARECRMPGAERCGAWSRSPARWRAVPPVWSQHRR